MAEVIKSLKKQGQVPYCVKINNKEVIKTTLHSNTTVFSDCYVNTYAQYQEALVNCGIKHGDKVILNSEVMTLGTKLKDLTTRASIADFFINGVVDLVGPSGAVFIPTFTYSFCKDEIFNPVISQTAIGILPKRALEWSGIYRNTQPLFSYVGIGDACETLFNTNNQTCFGKDSFHASIFKNNWKICCLGKKDLQMCTSLHAIEENFGVPYRYIKQFTGKVQIKTTLFDFKTDYYVRDLNQPYVYDFSKLQNEINKRGCYQRQKFGAGHISCYQSELLWQVGSEMLAKDPFCFAKIL